jgi:hypothetical protein
MSGSGSSVFGVFKEDPGMISVPPHYKYYSVKFENDLHKNEFV